MAQVRLEGIDKVFGTQQVLHSVDIDIEDSEFMVFVGPSGCGKTTLMRTIAGLERPDRGTVRIGTTDATHLHPAHRGVAMVFQSYALYPHMTVRENIAFGLRLSKKSRAEIAKAVDEVAAILQIEPLLDRKPAALSGGQRQRVAIGRAIVRDPQVFLFDEPLSNLDAALRVQMRVELIKLHRRLGATMVYVTHDQIEAMTMADRIVVLRDGRVEQVGTPLDLYERPNNRFVAGFIGSPKMNFLEVPLHESTGQSTTIGLPDDQSLTVPADSRNADPEGPFVLGIRPEHFGLDDGVDGPADVHLAAEVSVVEHLGGEIIVHARLADGREVQVKEAGHRRIANGDQVQIALRAAHCHLFDASGRALTRYDTHREAETPVGA
ncbi:ABC transporter ATP-binding protein [Salinisphaera hydrothermalis]|uniref:Sugar ABC transporter n=1 Tax=Salinisphaera hydrothermalis (strain C41B8) TaxID=1304275 RepID=A0A084IIM1_SALHC|nr:ABC transporter ATP-binding protein [Salinisphaera hydrothermalis]KEZ76555.1 sugar ABC transporter [Salinisphaera hydrothermalis C41B8]